MSAQKRTALTEAEILQLNDALEAAGIYLFVESQNGAVLLTGEVDSIEMRDAAVDLAEAIAVPRGLRIDVSIEVLEGGFSIDVAAGDDDIADDRLSPGSSTLTDLGTVDAEQAAEEGVPYFPPTDPVLWGEQRSTDDPVVLGGFQTTSMQGDDESASAPFRGDEQITEDVLRELREDAATTDLAIKVHTREGVVFLVGEVLTLDDAENAEAVAGRVSGVVEVREELKVRTLMTDHER